MSDLESIVKPPKMPPWQTADSRAEQLWLWAGEKKDSIKGMFNGTTLWHNLKDHLATSAGVVTGSLPVYAALEMQVAHLTSLESLYTRLSSAQAGFLGLNIAYVWGRELAYIAWGINEKSSGKKKRFADITYQGAFSLVTYPILTIAGRSMANTYIDLNKIAQETMFVSMMGLAAGMFVGISVDAYRELCGTHYSSRVPVKIRKWPKKAKIGLAILASCVSLKCADLIYTYANAHQQEPIHPHVVRD